MKQIVWSLLILSTISMAFIACGKSTGNNETGSETKTENANPLVGSWEVTADSTGTSTLGNVYEFTADGQLTIANTTKATWEKVSDTELKVTFPNLDPWPIEYSIEGDTLTYKMVNGGQTLTMKRK